MAPHRRHVVVLLLHLCGVFADGTPITSANNAQDVYRPQIWSVVNHLNGNPDRQYDFEFVRLLDAQKKSQDDVTFIEIEVAGECHAYTGCPDAAFVCKGFVEYIAATNDYQAMNVDCQPNIQAAPEVEPSVETTTEQRGQTHLPSVQKSEYCPGCTVDLDVNVPGVENLVTTALHHLEAERAKKHVSIRVLRLQREIVAGVKFVLLLEVAPTVCDAHVVENPPMCPVDAAAGTRVCRVEYIQKPWISDEKHIVGNNCTLSQDFAAVSAKRNRNDFDNEIDVNNEYKKSAEVPEVVPESPNYEKMAETGNLEPEISVARLLDLESQIIPTDPTDLSVLPLKVEATQFGVRNSQLAVEDVPSLPTSTDVLVSETTTGPESQDSTESSESVEERTRRQTTPDSSSSEESDEARTEPNDQPAATEVTTEAEFLEGTTEAVLERRKRSQDPNTSESLESDEAKKLKRKNPCEKSSSSSANDDIDNDCDQRGKRDVAGYNEEKQLVEDLAKFAGESLDDDTLRHEVLDIIKVKKLELEGAVYHLVVRFATTKCNEIGECYPAANDKLCKLMIHYAREHAKLLKHRCHPIERDVDKNRSKRQALGGVQPARDDEIIDHVRQTLIQLDSRSKLDHKFKLVKIHNSTKQVVSGFAYEIHADIVESDCLKNEPKEAALCGERQDAPVKTCKIKIWDQSWLPNGKKTDVFCGQEQHSFRSKRSIPGGANDAADDPETIKLVRESLILLDSKGLRENKYKLVQIRNATKQIVSGVLHKVKVDIIESDCPRTDPKDASLCGERKEASAETCEIEVWNQPWLPQGKKTEIKCGAAKHSFRSKRGVAGAPSDSTNDPEMLNLAKETLLQLDARSAHDNKYKVFKIHRASKQVVAGMLYKLKCDIIESDCLKNDNKDTSLCGEKKDAVAKTCDITIWDQPWLPNGRKTDVKCGEEQHSFRSKRSIAFDDLRARAGFRAFATKYDKVYKTPEEEEYRFGLFKENMKKAEELNKYEQGTAVYGASIFADLHVAEFRQRLGLRPELREENAIPYSQAKIPDVELPAAYDWRAKGAVTPVKDQGQCGSCWAFSVTGNVEGQYAIKHGQLLELSEQELVDCDTMDQGCNGGWMDNAYRVIEELGGLETESDYPYDAEDEKCAFKKSKARVQLSGAVNVSQNEDDMAKFLVKNGPISIGINANAMQLYMGGVSHPFKFLCDPNNLDHGVLIVGYGVDTFKLFNKTKPYWIVKNSWGPRWGEQGYYRVFRGDGTCGVNKMASSGVVV